MTERPHNEPDYPARSMAETVPEHGFCPVMSMSYPVQGSPAGIAAPSGTTFGTIVAQAPCMGAKCHWWRSETNGCAVLGLAGLV